MGKRTDLKTFSMNEATFNHLDLIAKRCGCSRSSVLAILINNYYEQLTKENEKLKEGKHAHWTVIALDCVDDLATLKCSRCGIEREVEDGYIPDYCEGCGAKMDEEKENKS